VGNEKQGLGAGRWGLGKVNSQLGLDVGCSEAKKQKDYLKMYERYGNVVESKGRPWKTPLESENVTENKGSYALNAGMLLKRKVVGRS
jgi:hypothetical protein